MENLTPEQISNIAKEAVKETLLSLGVPTDGHGDIISLQQDMAWLRRQRQSTEEIAKWVRRGMISAAVSGLLFILWEGFKIAIFK